MASRPGGFDGDADAIYLVGSEIVGDHDVAGPQGRHEDLLDVGEKAEAVHRAVEHAGRGESGDAETRDERTRLPVALRRVIGHALTAGTPPVAAEEIRGDAALVEKWNHLRVQSRIQKLQGRIQFGGALSGRDQNAVQRTMSGLLKLMHPDQDASIPDESIEWAARLALECRRRVKEQQKRIGSAEFRNTHFSY